MISRSFALALSVCLAVACGGSDDAAPSAGKPPAAEEVGAVPAKSSAPPARPRGRPLPAFSGWTLDDQRLDISELIGKRLLIYFFNPDVKQAVTVTEAVNAIAPERGKQNFEIVGIATGASRENAKAFVRRHGVGFPVIDDSSAALARRFGLREPIAMLGTDAEGFLSFGLAGFAADDPKAVEANLRKSLRLETASGPASDGRPEAPLFTASVLDADDSFDLAAQRGRPVVLIFFLHTCPHCHQALAFLKGALEAIPEDRRPKLVGMEVSGKVYAVRQRLKTDGLDFFPVLFDDEKGSTQNAYGIFGGVPDIFLIDPAGRISARTQGWTPERDEPLLRMRLAKIAGAPVPMLLRKEGYSGSEICGVCHELEHETWTFTTHASAYDTLVRHGVESNEECVSCHVVGHGKPGGFLTAAETPHLEDVGCESCHGRGGPHQSPGFLENGSYAETCVGCHDAKHSLGFDFATFGPRISHVQNAELASLSPEEKRKRLAERGRPGGSLLPTSAEYVGSDACRECHASEFETWVASPHARAVATLEAEGKAGDAACLRCHTTGFERPGGLPSADALGSYPDLARVGCESCHGPGGEHVKEGATRIGTILSLGDKCDSCVILQICGSCHDDANDPGFEFEVQDKIDAQRHGTIEPGTGKPKGTTAWQPLPAEPTRGRVSDARLLAHGFAQIDAER